MLSLCTKCVSFSFFEFAGQKGSKDKSKDKTLIVISATFNFLREQACIITHLLLMAWEVLEGVTKAIYNGILRLLYDSF